MLPDVDLEEQIARGSLVVDPAPGPSAIQPASIDLRLAHEFVFHARPPVAGEYIDPRRDVGHVNPERVVTRSDSVVLGPLGFCLARTVERIHLGIALAARVEGKSTLGRHGLAIHATAGFIDPGFNGCITLELFNFTQYPMKLTAGMQICQLAVQRMERPPRRPYGHRDLGSHYQGQSGVTLPR